MSALNDIRNAFSGIWLSPDPSHQAELGDDGIVRMVPQNDGENGETLERIVGYFKTKYPEDWQAAHLGPLCNGLDHMIAKLKGE